MEKNNQTLVERIFDDLMLQIEHERWKDGDRIPSENQLATQYGVSRVSIRAALQKLQGHGLITTIQGAGSFVNREEVEEQKEVRPSSYIQMNKEKQFEAFFELRKAIEFPSFHLFVKNATGVEYQTLKQLVGRLRERALEQDWQGFITYDLQFHMTVIRGGGNGFFIEIMDGYQDVFEQYLMRMSENNLKSILTVAEEHQTFYDLLVSGNPEGLCKYLYENNSFLLR